MRVSKEHKPQQSRVNEYHIQNENIQLRYKGLVAEARRTKAQNKIKLCDKAIKTKTFFNDREKFYKFITKHPSGSRYGFNDSEYWIRWPAYCTGDLPSMSVAILSGFRYGINICNGNKITAESKIPEVCSYLGAIVDSKDKGKIFIINDNGWVATCNHRTSSSIKFSWLTRVVATGEYYDDKEPDNKLLGKAYDNDVKEQIRSVWLGKDNQDANISTWLENKGIKNEVINDKDILVIWIRKSGERGGAHPENDTSFKAIQGYIEDTLYDTYILAGDKKGGKTTEIVKACSKKSVYDLTEFWKDSMVMTWGGNTRTGQLRLYDYLKNKSNKLKHIGSMSGGLEALALIGHDVDFKAKSGEAGVKRMEQYNKTIINYRRINFYVNHPFYDYKGFEKSFAKYYVFFSSGIIQGEISKNDAYDLYKKHYNPREDYKINGRGLTDNNARVALKVSKELAKKEKEFYQRKIQEEKKKEKEYRKIFAKGNPNRPKDFVRHHFI